MQPEFYPFPTTPHLAWLADDRPPVGEVLDASEAAELLAGDVVVEEKLDGTNLGLSLDAGGRVQAQARGQYLRPNASLEFGALWPWIETRMDALRAQLGPNLIVFGEWCYAVHSINYGQLPDWLLGFDVYDRQSASFWPTSQRNQLFAELDIVPVPELLCGRTDLPGLVDLLLRATSRVGAPLLEGLYVRRESADQLLARAKLVQPAFVPHLDEPAEPFRLNHLASSR